MHALPPAVVEPAGHPFGPIPTADTITIAARNANHLVRHCGGQWRAECSGSPTAREPRGQNQSTRVPNNPHRLNPRPSLRPAGR